jgi:uncharacterized protein (TIGR03000 family)
MKRSIQSLIWCGLASIAAVVCSGPIASAQCCGNSASQEIIYEGAPIASEPTAEELLDEIDDPSKIIHLTVIVKDEAVVKINGEETETKGTLRPYIVRGLTPGKSYKFTIEGLVTTKTGAEYFAKEEVVLKAGDNKQVVLQVRRRNRTPPPAPPAGAPPIAAAAAAAGK